MAETKNSNRRSSQGDASAAQALVVSGLPTCTIHAAEDGTWHVVAQLTEHEEAAFAASAPTSDNLCRGSERSAIGVYADRSGAPFGEPTLVLDGPAVLWAFGHARPDAIRALLQEARQAMRQSPP